MINLKYNAKNFSPEHSNEPKATTGGGITL